MSQSKRHVRVTQGTQSLEQDSRPRPGWVVEETDVGPGVSLGGYKRDTKQATALIRGGELEPLQLFQALI